MGVDHILHGVGYDVAAGQRIEHTVVTHCDAVVDGYRVEFGGIAAHGLNLFLDYLANLVQMGVTRYKLCEGIYYGDDGLAKLFALHSGGYPQCT